jgi:hypothetical protein
MGYVGVLLVVHSEVLSTCSRRQQAVGAVDQTRGNQRSSDESEHFKLFRHTSRFTKSWVVIPAEGKWCRF